MSARPLTVAVAAYLLGGLGNVAFSAHSGSVAGLVFSRFVLGALCTSGFLWFRRPERPALRTVRYPRMLLTVSAASESGSIVLLIAASEYVSTLVFTLVGLAGTAVSALAGRRLALGSGSRAQALTAAAAVCAAAVSVLVSDDISGSAGITGVVLAVGSTALGLIASLTGSFAASVRHPAEIVRTMTVWGCAWAGILVVAGAEFSLTWSTIAAASFIALLPGGVAKAAIYWAFARSAPYLVSACSAVALLSAGLGGWLLLGEVPSPVAMIFAVVAAVLVSVLSLLDPDRRQRSVSMAAAGPAPGV